MDLHLDGEQELLRDSVRKFLAAECPRQRLDAIDADPRGHSAELWETMADLGWMGLCASQQYGGSGLGLRELCIVIEEFGRASLASPYFGTMVCQLAIARFGSDVQRDMLLPQIAAGRCIVAYARCDPEEPWEPLRSGVIAEPRADGHVLRGSSHFAPFAQVADRLLVLAHIGEPNRERWGLFILDARSAGLRAEPLEVVGSERQCLLHFDDCAVAAGDALGAIGDTGSIVRALDAWILVARCAEMVGGAQRVLELAAAYACERRAFGKPIGSFQAIQHHCANMAVDVLGARLITDEAIWLIEHGEPDASDHAAVAKAWVGEAYRKVCSLGHQVHGAVGFTWEHDLQRYFRHAFAADLAHGDSLHHLDRIATRLGL